MTARGRRPGPAATALLALLAAALAACSAVTPGAPAAEIVAGASWRAGERYEYVLTDGAGVVVGRGVLTTTREGDRLVLGQRYTEAAPPAGATPTHDAITVTVDAATLWPIEGARETLRRDTDGGTRTQRDTWTYRDGDGTRRLATHQEREGEAARDRDLAVRAHAYDNESSLWLWRAIAFAEGYEARYLSVNPFDRSQQTVALSVPQRETVTVPAGTFETWRILVRSGRAARTAWVNQQAPHEVVRWDNGDLVFELLKRE